MTTQPTISNEAAEIMEVAGRMETIASLLKAMDATGCMALAQAKGSRDLENAIFAAIDAAQKAKRIAQQERINLLQKVGL